MTELRGHQIIEVNGAMWSNVCTLCGGADIEERGDPTTCDGPAALAWCRVHNARIRFQSDGSVSVSVNFKTRRRPTFTEACKAIRIAVETP